MNLYMFYNQQFIDSARYITTYEHVWCKDDEDAESFKQKNKWDMVYLIYAAATTDNKPTPPGLDTYKVVQGEKL